MRTRRFTNLEVALKTALGLGSATALAACSVPCGAACEQAPGGHTNGTPSFVSLNPCLDAILVEVADDAQILALSHYSHNPAASSMDVARARQFAITGGSAEEVIALSPDIVLASQFIAPATRSALERAGLRVETFGSASSVEISQQQIARMAQLTGGHDRGEILSRSLDAHSRPRAASLVLAEDAKPRPLSSGDPSVLLWQSGEIVAGETVLITQLIEEARFTNHARSLGLGQSDRIALEQIIADPPDLLLIAGDSYGQSHPALDRLDGVMIHSFDPRLFYCGGPSIPIARGELERLRRLFEPVPDASGAAM